VESGRYERLIAKVARLKQYESLDVVYLAAVVGSCYGHGRTQGKKSRGKLRSAQFDCTLGDSEVAIVQGGILRCLVLKLTENVREANPDTCMAIRSVKDLYHG
jgi:hypothetical protein